jgi:hypothetical protein
MLDRDHSLDRCTRERMGTSTKIPETVGKNMTTVPDHGTLSISHKTGSGLNRMPQQQKQSYQQHNPNSQTNAQQAQQQEQSTQPQRPQSSQSDTRVVDRKRRTAGTLQ